MGKTGAGDKCTMGAHGFPRPLQCPMGVQKVQAFLGGPTGARIAIKDFSWCL